MTNEMIYDITCTIIDNTKGNNPSETPCTECERGTRSKTNFEVGASGETRRHAIKNLMNEKRTKRSVRGKSTGYG